MIKAIRTPLLVALLLAGIALPTHAAPLNDAFREPPENARPETVFHLIGGNITKPGLAADLAAISEAGFGGIQLFSVSGEPWPGVEPQVACLSPQWDQMISYVADECRRLGLRFTMENCPGSSMSGGPWITPDNSMRELVWSRIDVARRKALTIKLPRPHPSNEEWRNYRDVAVLAFPTPEGDDGKDLVPTAVRSNRSKELWADLVAGKLVGKKEEQVCIDPGDGPAWLEVDFDAPKTLRSIVLPSVMRMVYPRYFDPGMAIRVEVKSEEGWNEVARREIPRSSWQDDKPLTLALPDSTAKTFRILFELKNPIFLDFLKFSSAARIDDWEGQAAYTLRSLDYFSTLQKQNSKAWVDPGKIIDLSKNLGADGELSWDVPAGKWTILRFGNVNSGERNNPAPKEATGFECDKLASAGAEQHFAGYIGRISGQGGPADQGRLQGMLLDGWECSTQTWTPAMEQEFSARRGYVMRKWLPALAGYVVGDPEHSERFLRDWRATINDLLVNDYFGRLSALAHQRGLKVSIGPAVGDIQPGDILEYFRQADIPMCEFWQPNDIDWGGLEAKPITPCVSAAHVYGKNQIAAEAFSSSELSWDEHPFMLKYLADRHFTYGLNHLVFHTFTHNPRLDVIPGASLGGNYGTPFLRNQTWWKFMPLFTSYIARCQFMLKQGRPVADVLWFLGDDLDGKPRADTPFPCDFHFDYINPDALMNRIKVLDGKLTTPEGLAWKVLWLPKCPRMTLETLGRIRDLLHDGATVIGVPPLQNASLLGGDDADSQFSALVKELWGVKPGFNGDRKIGAGRLLWGGGLALILDKLAIEPDVIGASSATWCHRRTDDLDIYFVAAERDQELTANLGFRAKGRPEFFDPMTGASTPVSVFQRQGNHTFIPFDLPAAAALFVVFHKGEAVGQHITRVERDGKVLFDAGDLAEADRGNPPGIQGLRLGEPVQPWVEHELPECEIADGGTRLLAWEPGHYRVLSGDKLLLDTTVDNLPKIKVAGPWKLAFPRGWDTPELIELPELKSWSYLEDPATRAFSGSATYSCNLTVPHLTPGMHAMLDLGDVGIIAELSVNGKPVATLWTAPFRADITSFLKPGNNRISVTVTNNWNSRLVYDETLPESERKTWTLVRPDPYAHRHDSGLRGPIILRTGMDVPIPRK